MPLNPPSGNMYPWAYTWNPIGGRCSHACGYCYVERLRQRGVTKYSKPPHLVEKEFKTKLDIPDDYILFVCSCYDMLGNWVPDMWILRILEYLRQFPNTTCLIQSKNPQRFFKFEFPKNVIFGTTIETNREYKLTKAPQPKERFLEMKRLPMEREIMVSIEPIMDFDLPILLSWMGVLRPQFVSIGADSGHNNLFEPPSLKLKQLLWQLELVTEVRRKKNLDRLLEKEQQP